MATSYVLALRPFVPIFQRGLVTRRTTKQMITYVESSHAPSSWSQKSAVVYPNIITENDEKFLLDVLNQRFKRRRYEDGHWDSAIQKYRELELFEEDEMKSILDSIRSHIETHHHHNCSNEKNSSEDSKLGITGAGWLPVHVIDLHADGRLNAHVDSVRFSGNIVAGLSLLSDCVMRLKPDVDPVEKNMMRDGQLKHWIDLYLPARSLYVLSGTSRYDYTHEILPSESFWLGKYPKDIPLRERRLSLIFRDAKQADKDPSNDITSKISDPDETIMDNDVRNHQNEPSA